MGGEGEEAEDDELRGEIADLWKLAKPRERRR